MKVNELHIIRYLRDIYGGTLSGVGNCLYLKINEDKFRVNLADKKQFGYYSFFHCTMGGHYYRIYLKDKNLAHGLFLVWSNKLSKDIGLYPSEEDWLRFASDAKKLLERR